MRRYFKGLPVGLVILPLICLMPLVKVSAQYYSGSQMEFGKNRVQYSPVIWSFFKFTDFDVYFYQNGKELALFTSKYAEEQIAAIEKRLEASLEGKIQFIIFNTLSDRRQSNIGLTEDDPYNTGGVTRILGQKVILYFEGDHELFKRQIRQGITEVILNQMLYGSSLTSQVKNSTLLFLPAWYTRGLSSYLTEDWNTIIDDHVRDGILTGRYRRFNQLTGADAGYAGHSLWRYVAEKYGNSAVSNIIYMAKISKSVESGFLYVLGISFRNITRDWINYYDLRYRLNLDLDNLPAMDSRIVKPRPERNYQQLKLSSDGNNAAYVTNESGLYKVWLYQLAKHKKKKLLKRGYRLDGETDLTYPLLAWHPTGRLLSILTEEKGKITLYFYTPSRGTMEKRFLFNFDKILSFSYSPDGKSYVMSAVIKGQSDIFIYNIAANSYERLTNDIFDDLYPVYFAGGRQVIFSSNRTTDSLKPLIPGGFYRKMPSSRDLYLYDLKSRPDVLKRITATPLADEIRAADFQGSYFSYLSDENGIYNRYLARFDSAVSYIDTVTHYRYFTVSYPVSNYSRNILEHDISRASGRYAEIIMLGNRHHMFIHELPDPASFMQLTLSGTDYRALTVERKIKEESDSMLAVKKTYQANRKRFVNVRKDEIDQGADTLYTIPGRKIDINNYVFDKQSFIRLSGRDSIQQAGAGKVGQAGKEGVPQEILPKQLNYVVEYGINEIISQVDFNYLNYSYQTFTGGNSPIWLNPGFGVRMQVGASDLMEDHRIVGGMRPGLFSLTNNEYLLSYANLSGRVDKEIGFHRFVNEESYETTVQMISRIQSHEVFYNMKYPFDEVFAVKGLVMYRHDHISQLSTEQQTLRMPNTNTNWGVIKGELIYDDTRSLGLNLYQGTRYKAFAEYFQKIQKSGQENFFVLGFDYRKYLRIHRTLIWANRFAASTSFGNRTLIYYLGGVDTWLAPRFNKEVPVSTDRNYTYQTLATNLRGFTQNIRNGNSFALINSELRVPVIRYFANRPIKSDFLNNFQFIAFGDIGTAWNGPSPYSKENSLYKKVIVQGPITVTVDNQVDPIVGGYGFGLRSRLLGYFMRADWAWGIEDMKVQKGIFYFSLSLDF